MSRTIIRLLRDNTLDATSTNPALVSAFNLLDWSPYWNNAVLELKVSNGSIPELAGNVIRLYYTYSSFDVNLQLAPQTFETVSVLETTTSGIPDTSAIVSSGSIPVEGDWLYTWIETDRPLLQPVTINLITLKIN